jgi:potassium-transporting ATPase KdpC subunit
MPSPLPSLARTHLAALRMLLVLTVLCGLAYPLLITGVARVAFPHRADGSPVAVAGHTAGSSLLGQEFTLPGKDAGPDPKWFQPRPSAGDYDPTASGASNLGPNSPTLVEAVEQRRAAVAAFDGVSPASVPVDALTASGSGLDPDISPAYAYEQADRVAKARGLTAARVHALVAAHVQGRTLGFLGEPRVDVVTLNAALAGLG